MIEVVFFILIRICFDSFECSKLFFAGFSLLSSLAHYATFYTPCFLLKIWNAMTIINRLLKSFLFQNPNFKIALSWDLYRCYFGFLRLFHDWEVWVLLGVSLQEARIWLWWGMAVFLSQVILLLGQLPFDVGGSK